MAKPSSPYPIVQRLDNGHLKAAALCEVARALHFAGEANQVGAILCDAFATARRIGRDQLFEVLEETARTSWCD